MKLRLILLLFITPMFVQAGTIDSYIKKAESNPFWDNVTCAYVEPVPGFNPDKMLENAFKVISLDEGKPAKWKIIEHKKSNINNAYYYLIRFVAFDKEHLLVFNLDVDNGKWCVSGGLVAQTNLVGGHDLQDTKDIVPKAQEILNRLNDWDHEELDAYECPEHYPLRKTPGETGGWIISHEQELEKLGFVAHWNCIKLRYEITNEEVRQPSFCQCQRKAKQINKTPE